MSLSLFKMGTYLILPEFPFTPWLELIRRLQASQSTGVPEALTLLRVGSTNISEPVYRSVVHLSAM